jgi:transposase-like protein
MFEQFKGVSLIKFSDTFKSMEECKKYLSHYKWDNGFVCSKCGHDQNWEGIKPYTKVCKNCRHVESVTANTLFHKVKFDLRKAFLILFEMSTSSKGTSSPNIANRYDINQKTAWLFMSKIRKAMESSGLHLLKGDCESDECYIGGHKEGKVGRGSDKKKTVAVVIEKSGEHGIKRAYAVKIANCSSKELGRVFDKFISKTANVKTDKWKGYLPLVQSFNIVQEKSDPKVNFKLTHRFVQGLKSWVRGIYHHISEDFTQSYLDEYCYRFNRHGSKETVFDNLVQKMMATKPLYNYKT